jgi:hypothetical protein
MLVTNEKAARENEESKVCSRLSPLTSDNGCKKSIQGIAQLTVQPVGQTGVSL